MRETDPTATDWDAEDATVGVLPDFDDLSAERTFRILGSEIRLSILRALWNAPDEPVSFAELSRYPYVETDNLDYHLDKLVGLFVRRSDDGYSLRYAGEQVMRAMLTGVFTESPTLSPVESDTRCPYCGGAVELAYREERLSARCTECGGVTRDGFPDGTYLSYGLPPSGLQDRSRNEILGAAHVFFDSKITPMMNGICPECASTVGHSFDICTDHGVGPDGICDACDTRFEVWTEYSCSHCAYTRTCALWFTVLLHPRVISFYHEVGDLDEPIPFSKLTWENAHYVRNISTSVAGRDPLRFNVDIPIEDARLTVTLDADLEVLEFERADRGPERDAAVDGR